MKRANKYNLVIYICLLLATIIIFKVYKVNESIAYRNDQNKVVKVKYEEPKELQEIDKKPIIKEYLDKVRDKIIEDDSFINNEIDTWGNYRIEDVKYNKEILTNYHSYLVSIKIPNLNASVPTKKDNLVKEDYLILKVYANIVKQGNNYIVKKIDLIL